MPKKSKRAVKTENEGNTMELDDTTCSVCYAEFLEPEDLELHVQQVHPSTGIARCPFCDKAFSDAEKCAVHIKDQHLTDVRSCTFCSRVFINAEDLRLHTKKHEHGKSRNNFVCSQCPLLFDNHVALNRHEFTEHSDVTEGVFLNEYYALLSSIINIKADSIIKAISSDFIYVCAACKYTDIDFKGYNAHLKEKGCRSFACNGCYKVYFKRKSLIEHVTKYPECFNATNDSSKKECSVCRKKFNTNVFKQHARNCKVYRCTTCDITFEALYDLSAHQSKEHPLAVSLVVCTFCRREFVGNIALQKHIQRTHDAELHLYKYACSYCDAVYKHPQRLFGHYFTKHKDLEPYMCKICNKKFRIRKKFTLHIKLAHESKGFVEFDENLHVYFALKKSEKPFQPVSKFVSTTAKSNAKSKGGDKSGENVKDENLGNSDFMNQTETDANQTDAYQTDAIQTDVNQTDINETDVNDANKTVQQKRKRKTRTMKPSKMIDALPLSDGDSEEESLLVIKKRAKIKMHLRKKTLSKGSRQIKKDMKRKLTCEICKKYCYTFQNYQNHVSMHFKDESKKCVKCSRMFKSKADLERHLVQQHSSSKLTEYLKKVLERRKMGEERQEISMTRKFLNTVKKAQIDTDRVTATLKPVKEELSVQSFIENFTPETNESKGIQIKDSITLTKVDGSITRTPLIKMTKFNPGPKINEANIRLSMPVKFKKTIEKHTVTIKKVKWNEFENKVKLNFDYSNQYQDEYENNDYGDSYQDNDYEENKDTYIPEAEQEVTLEGTEAEELPKKNVATHKIVIPKLPKELKSIRIAHLLPEAPYYKIVKMDDIMNKSAKQKKEEPKEAVKNDAPVLLPDGTRLVHVNPLAHLLGDTPVEKIVKNTSKYYKPKTRNIKDVMAKALLKLEAPKKRKKVEKEKTSKKAAAKEKEGERTTDVDIEELTEVLNDSEDVIKESELAESVQTEELEVES